ncbi:MAG: MMPL family transporter, partial [Firmicutes bacterium]|nr:MMPL family transporter [Bacillota bacterium]
LSGGARAYTAVANTGLWHGLLATIILAFVGTLFALKRIIPGVMPGILAIGFDAAVLLTGLSIARIWGTHTHTLLLFPMIIVVISLLLALSLDYEILLVHNIGDQPTNQRIGSALSETGGAITGAGSIIATTFLTLMLTPIPFLQLTGLIIGASLLLDTLVIRSLFIPTALMTFSTPWPSKWKHGVDTVIGRLGILIGLILLTLIISHTLQTTTLAPPRLPSWTIHTTPVWWRRSFSWITAHF